MVEPIFFTDTDSNNDNNNFCPVKDYTKFDTKTKIYTNKLNGHSTLLGALLFGGTLRVLVLEEHHRLRDLCTLTLLGFTQYNNVLVERQVRTVHHRRRVKVPAHTGNQQSVARHIVTILFLVVLSSDVSTMEHRRRVHHSALLCVATFWLDVPDTTNLALDL